MITNTVMMTQQLCSFSCFDLYQGKQTVQLFKYEEMR
jgi:hypothetical protein